jgi:type IV secretion system protein VirB4
VALAGELVLKREASAAHAISLAAHVDSTTIVTEAGDYVQTFELEGVAHETASDEEICAWHENICQFARSISSLHIALWSYVSRVPLADYPAGDFEPGYAHDLNDRYRQHALRRGQFGSRLHLAILYRPHATRLARVSARLDRKNKDTAAAQHAAAIDRLDGIERDVMKWLARWSPRRLTTYNWNNLVFSEPLEFYGSLVNGYAQRMPIRRANIAQTLMTTRPLFGNETFELRGPAESTFGAMLEFKEFPDEVFPGGLDELLRLNTSLVLAQSFAFMERAQARGEINRQFNRLESTNDDAISQIDELSDAKDDLASGRYVMGEHHITLMVMTPHPNQLSSAVAEARQAMSAGGGVVTRASLEMESAFWSVLPGAFKRRPRPGMLASRPWAALNAMHAYPTGKAKNNHWGPALTLLRTANGSPFFFNLHRADVGHFCLLGSTGAGKTVFTLFLVAMMSRMGTQITYYDKDHGAEIAIRALGGQYFDIKPGEPSGFAPFALPGTMENIAAVQLLMRAILRDGENPLTAREMTDIDAAVEGTFTHGRLAHMMSYLPPAEGNNLAERLKRWVVSDEGQGPLAWVFDNEVDALNLSAAKINALDMTYFLDAPEVRTPIMMYLEHRSNQLKDGRRMATIVDEGWKALDDPILEAQLADAFKTDRKKNALMGLITQSPSDALRSKAARTIIEQTPTKIFLPNIEANEAEYVEGFGLTAGEFATFRELSDSSRRFLVKQGKNSVICELDLSDFPNDLAVLSGTAQSVRLLDELRAQHGDDPLVWMPHFQEQRRNL